MNKSERAILKDVPETSNADVKTIFISLSVTTLIFAIFISI